MSDRAHDKRTAQGRAHRDVIPGVPAAEEHRDEGDHALGQRGADRSLEPVPHPDRREGTRLSYTGQLGTDLWGFGSRWADVVAAPWERTVAATFETVQREAERRNRTASHAR